MVPPNRRVDAVPFVTRNETSKIALQESKNTKLRKRNPIHQIAHFARGKMPLPSARFESVDREEQAITQGKKDWQENKQVRGVFK